MSTPSQRTTSRFLLASVVASAIALVLVASWLCTSRTEDRNDPSISTPSLDSRTVHAASERRQLVSEDSSARESPVDSDSHRELVTRSSTATPTRASGVLALHVVDNGALDPLRWFSVRAISATRFAEERCEGATDFELRLTPGSYALLVASPGHEVFELPSVQIASGAITRLPTIELRAGSARIEGEIIGPAPSDHTFMVELIGAGRQPCVQCAEPIDPDASAAERAEKAWSREKPCSVCGFARDQSCLFVHGGDSFAFLDLVSGPYAIRLADGSSTIGVVRPIVLAEGALASIVLDASNQRMVELEVFDGDGTSLSKLWARRRAWTRPAVEPQDADALVGTATVEIAFSIDRACVGNTTFVPPLTARRVRMAPLMLFNEDAVTARALDDAVWAAILVAQAPHLHHPVDRERTAADSLHPSAQPVQFENAKLRCDLGENGLLTVGPVPTCRLQMRVTSAGSSAEAFIPASHEDMRVEIWLHAD
jgi:hypothetical protein